MIDLPSGASVFLAERRPDAGRQAVGSPSVS
jgi:hypothetical protein